MVTDESSLWDFTGFTEKHLIDVKRSEVFDRIRESYGVDVSDVKNGNLVAIFARLRAGARPVSISVH
jgi:hypothetical protein